MAALAFWRDGLARQVAALLVLTLALVVGGSWLAARSTQTILGRVVDQYTGDRGRYDLLVQLQVGAGGTRQDLEQVLHRELPGARVYPGVTLGGQENDFLSLPEQLIRPDVLESLDRVLGQVPGYSGYTLLMQPVLTVGRVQAPWQSTVQRLVASQPGVRLTFWHGHDLVVLLRDAQALATVRPVLERWLGERTIFRLQLPPAYQLTQAQEVAGKVARRWQALHPDLPLQPLTTSDGGVDTEGTGSGADANTIGGATGAVAAGNPVPTVDSLRSVGRLLDFYLTRISLPIPPDAGQAVRPGQQWLVTPVDSAPAGHSPARSPNAAGPRGSLPSQAVLAQVVEVTRGDGSSRPSVVPTATAVVVQGRWPAGVQGKVYTWADGRPGRELGQAAVSAPRQQLASQLEQLSAWAQTGSSGTAGAAAGNGNGGGSSPATPNLAQTLADVDQALAAAEALPQQLTQALAQASPGQQNQLLAQLALEALGRKILGSSGSSTSGGPVTGIDPGQIGQLRQELAKVQKGLAQLNGPSGAALNAVHLSDLAASLRQMDDGELGKAWLALRSWQTESLAAAPGEVAWWGSPSVSLPALQVVVRRELGSDSLGRVVALPVATLVPDARTELLQMAARSGQLVGVVAAGLLTLLALLLDQATLLATWEGILRAKARVTPSWRRRRYVPGFLTSWVRGIGPRLYGSGVGVGLLVGGVLAATAGHPSTSTLWGAAGAGACLGLAVAAMAERLSPVPADQVLAGESLALSYCQIMTEIVVPAGRPGLYQLLVAAVHRLQWGRVPHSAPAPAWSTRSRSKAMVVRDLRTPLIRGGE